MSSLSVIVVSFNSEHELAGCLESVARGSAEVIVVDNASTDGSRRLVRDRFPAVRLVELTENLGFGAGANAGMQVASGDFLLILNPDARPVAGAIERLIACAERDPGLGAVAARLQDADGAPQLSFLPFPSLLWTGRPPVSSHASAGRVDALRHRPRARMVAVGAALLLRRDAAEEVAGFDPAFFMFFEDVDLSWRLQERGWRVGCCPEAHVVHDGGASTRRLWPGLYKEHLRGYLRFVSKTRGAAAAGFARRWLVGALLIRGLLASGESRRAYFGAARWLASSRVDTLLER